MIFTEKKGLIRKYVIIKFKIARHGIVYLSAETSIGIVYLSAETTIKIY